ncbi:MAG: polysaccharide deacetylase family protein [Chitinophagaceae bacterium]|nr:polysaccharide deacetylase family protein [Chitinophagaceae bacterium]
MQVPYNTIHLLRSRLKGLPDDMAMFLGRKSLVLKEGKGARILVYHGLCKKDHLRFNSLFITKRMFEKHLQLYNKYCHLISLDDYYGEQFSKDRFNICLSFDDGFANNHSYVLPLLEQYEIPAVFFITGIRQAGYDVLWNDVLAIAYRYGPDKLILKNRKFIKRKDRKYVDAGSGELLADILRATDFAGKEQMMEVLGSFKDRADQEYWLQMTTEQIKQLSASKWVTIGSHGYYHNDLANLPAESAKLEMQQSRQFLEDVTGKEVRALAFPYGSYSAETIVGAKEAGFTRLLATDFLFPSDGNDTTLRERFTINPFISSINQLHACIRGTYT